MYIEIYKREQFERKCEFYVLETVFIIIQTGSRSQLINGKSKLKKVGSILLGISN